MDHRIEKLRIGTKYVAQIRSINEDQTSEWSPAFYITTPSDTTVPGNVTGLAGSYVGGSFKWVWVKPPHNADGKPFKDFSHYEVTISDGTNSYVDRTTIPEYFVGVAEYQTSLGNGAAVSISVKAVDYSDNKSITPATNTVTAPTPSTITGSATVSGAASVRITWDEVTNVPIDEYEVYSDDASGFTPDTSTYTNISGRTSDSAFIWTAGETGVVTKYFKTRAKSVYGTYGGFEQVSGSTLSVSGGGGGGGSTSSYEDVVGSYSPLGYWRLNESSGTSAADLGSNADAGTYTGGATLGAAALAGGLEQSTTLDGTNDYINIPSTDYQSLTSSWTLMGWVKFTGTGQHVIVGHEFNGTKVPFVLGSVSTFASSGKFGCGFYNGSWYGVSGTTTYTSGVPYFVAGTWDGTNLKVYVDGVLEGTSTPGASPIAAISPAVNVYLGKRWDTSSPEFWPGDLSDVAIFSSALTASNILEIYNAGIAAGAVSGPSIQRETFTYQGVIATLTGGARLYVEQDSTILSCRASVGTAPTGSSIITDIHKNGTTIFTTQANRPTIAASGNTSGAITNMNVTALSAGDYLTVDVDQVGSTIAGADLTVTVTLETV